MDSAGDPGLASWHTTFHFDTDEKRLNSIREIKARLKPLEDKIDRFKADRHVSVQISSVVFVCQVLCYSKCFCHAFVASL